MTTAYPAWAYREKPIVVNNPSLLDGVQGHITLSWVPGMKTDFADIRFSDTSGNALYYYIETLIESTSVKIWVKLPANQPRIYYYYGNVEAESESDGDNTFEFFDDFSGTSINTTKWNVYRAAVISDGKAKIGQAGSSASCFIYSKTTFGEGYTVIARALLPQQRGQFDAVGFVQFSGDNLFRAVAWTTYQNAPKTSFWWFSYVDRTLTADFSNAYHVFEIQRKGSGKSRLIVDGTTIIDDQAGSFTDSLSVGARAFDYNSYVYVDYIFVLKYIETRPSLEVDVQDIVIGRNSIVIRASSRYIDYIVARKKISVIAHLWIGGLDEIATTKKIKIKASSSIKDKNELWDYSLNSVDISKSITDAYTQLSASFEDDVVPEENKPVKHNYYDPEYLYRIVTSDGFRIVSSDEYRIVVPKQTLEERRHLYFVGKVISRAHTLSYLGNELKMLAADNTRNLISQHVPWKYQIVSMSNPDFPDMYWALWIWYLLGTDSTGVVVGNIQSVDMPDKQFIFKPDTTRLDAIKEIANYCGLVVHTKLKETYVVEGYNEVLKTVPHFYAVSPSEIDQPSGGFDLPSPVTFTWPDPNIVDEPTVEFEQEEKINQVTIHGVLTSTGETVVATVRTPEVESGEEFANEFTFEDNNIFEKGSTAETEAVKWLLYYTVRRATVTMKLIDRYNLELYQRIKFGQGFTQALRNLTNSIQLSHVIAFDPNDEYNSKHTIDVSGVPCPSWLRVSSMKYHGELNDEYLEVQSITDFIYSSADPTVPEPYSVYIPPGYLKPVESDSVSQIHEIIDSRIKKQLQTDYGTVISKNEDGKTVQVMTISGKVLTVIAQSIDIYQYIIIIPDGKGNYYGVQPG